MNSKYNIPLEWPRPVYAIKNFIMAKNPGYIFEIKEGAHAGKKAIAYHSKQERAFKEKNKFAVTIFETDFKTVVKENVLINESNLKFIGFSD